VAAPQGRGEELSTQKRVLTLPGKGLGWDGTYGFNQKKKK
jgi:hypothetical protein